MPTFLEDVLAARTAWQAAHPGEKMPPEVEEELIGQARRARPPPPRQQTDEAITALVEGILDGRIWVESGKDLERIDSAFRTVIAVAGVGLIRALFEQQACIYYEDIEKASPLAVNGRPIFLSFHFLNITDADAFYERLKTLQAERG